MRVLTDFSAEMKVWTVVHPDLRDVPRIKVVMDTLKRMLKTYAGMT